MAVLVAARRVAGVAHNAQRVTAADFLAHRYQQLGAVAEIQEVDHIRRLARVQLHADVPAPLPRFIGAVRHDASPRDRAGDFLAVVIRHSDFITVQADDINAAVPGLAVVPRPAEAAIVVPHFRAALKDSGLFHFLFLSPRRGRGL